MVPVLPVRQALIIVVGALLVGAAPAQRDDLGSADGFYTVRLARAVGPTGMAYAIRARKQNARRQP